ncbi:MAG: alpha/beta fold hydrolase [Anaerolineae bacterium]|nr:alpha/beta fold hydrolase [Anaerolineae bacterium]
MHRRWILLSLLLLLVFIVPTLAQEEGPPQVGLRPDAPTYALHGPYWVGTQEFVIEDAERPIPLTVWYPALNPENKEESVAYTPIIKWVTMPEGDYTVIGRALRDASPDAVDAPYPLIVFSHGYAAFPARHAYFPEHLASYGFVVVAPDHPEHWYFEGDPNRDVLQITADRPRDIVRVLDYADSLTGSGGMFEGLIDMDQVAISGHSYGGYTALAAAGARYDLEAYNTYCADVSDDPAVSEVLFCPQIVPNEVELARLAGLDPMPEGLWPSMGDPRIKAVLPLAGDAYLFGNDGLAEVTIPMLAMGGTLDTSTPYAWGARFAYDHIGSQQKSLVGIESAEHSLFNTPCNDELWMLDIGAHYFCSDAVWDMDRAHDLINHFATAFLLDVLKGDAEAHAALLAENVDFPGIAYETTLK